VKLHSSRLYAVIFQYQEQKTLHSTFQTQLLFYHADSNVYFADVNIL